jgi:peroxiredoxin
MNRLSRLCAIVSLLLASVSHGSPAEARRIQKSWDLLMENWSLETRTAPTPEARAKAYAERPDAAPFVRQMWETISPSLNEEWILEPAAWFLRAAPGLFVTNPQGGTAPAFAKEIETLRKAIETRHAKSPKLIPVCMALVTNQDPRSLSILEKIQSTNPDKKIQGVAALAAAMVIKTLGDDTELMRKRINYLRKAIIESAEVSLGDTTVAKLAEDELYIISHLSKGRVAPDLSGTDAAGKPMKLSDHKGKVILLLFWNSGLQDSERLVRITTEMTAKFQGKPFIVIGVNHDTRETLRKLVGDGSVPWSNLSDPDKKLAAEYRVGTWPLAYVLDGERKIHYSGAQGSFAELTAEALLAETQPATNE